jgi:hypothetical protein
MTSFLRRFVLLVPILFLTACIPVDDFGTYWAKATLDKAILGKWEKKEKGSRTERVKITLDDGRYLIDTLDREEKKKKDYSPTYARTFTTGKYTFFMAMSYKNGQSYLTPEGLVRYELKGNVLTEYNLADLNMGRRLTEKYPHARNFVVPDCNKNCAYYALKIRKLDAEVAQILADIPDTKEFWSKSDVWKRMK